ncbi:MAG TPA: protein-methionine-sulfoxide reductase heme-binding subunit MsrQ [Bacteroidota bacterium]|nr:protein-methionine-sulfoxide reductase heme-binding subunit MsrQ [Bacteroidota bacterium]
MKRLYKPAIFLLSLVPLGLLAYRGFTDALGANPVSEIQNETGVWTLRFLVAVLAITPLRKITGWSGIQQFQRMLGLFAFFYSCLHLSTYLVLDQSLVLGDILHDVVKRPFITVGFGAFVLMIPLAITSTKKMIKRLGGKRWKALHRLVYVTAMLGVIHYLWLVKADKLHPYTYGAIFSVLLGYRLVDYVIRRNKRNAASPARVMVT